RGATRARARALVDPRRCQRLARSPAVCRDRARHRRGPAGALAPRPDARETGAARRCRRDRRVVVSGGTGGPRRRVGPGPHSRSADAAGYAGLHALEPGWGRGRGRGRGRHGGPALAPDAAPLCARAAGPARGGGGGGGGLVAVGRLSAQKRIALLREAVAQLRATGRGLPLTIVGDGPERPALERRAAELGVADSVRFLGEVPPARIPDVLGDADVFAFPAIGEGLGLAAAEALMLGVPIVATRDGGGITDIVPSNGAGRLVQPDAREFARALRELADTPDSRRLAAEAGAALRR